MEDREPIGSPAAPRETDLELHAPEAADPAAEGGLNQSFRYRCVRNPFALMGQDAAQEGRRWSRRDR